MLTLSLYLLLAAVGALVAAILAYTAFSIAPQIITAALITLIGWALLHKFRPEKKHLDHRTNPDLNMDIGQTVRITGINASGTLIVPLRGANWEGILDDRNAQPDLNRQYQIVKIDGSRLILQPKD